MTLILRLHSEMKNEMKNVWITFSIRLSAKKKHGKNPTFLCIFILKSSIIFFETTSGEIRPVSASKILASSLSVCPAELRPFAAATELAAVR